MLLALKVMLLEIEVMLLAAEVMPLYAEVMLLHSQVFEKYYEFLMAVFKKNPKNCLLIISKLWVD